MNKIFLIYFAFVGYCLGQTNSVALSDFKNQHVLYTDFGISPAPFSLSYPFSSAENEIKYKNNFKPILGLGYAYKWFSMRIAFPILPGVRSSEKFGESRQFGVGFDYAFKRLYMDFDLRAIQGYALKNALDFDTSFTKEAPNLLLPNLGSINLAMNLWYFNHDDFKMNALQGKRAHFEKEVHTWYLKGTLNYFGVGNGNDPIIPTLLQDVTQSKTSALSYASLDFGAIPGYAYANRINNWQFSGWAGIGPVIQTKFYTLPNEANGFIGLAPRYDIRFVGGYSTEKNFVLITTTFDNKSIAFNNLNYRQYFYTIRVVTGVRIPPTKPHQGGRHSQS